MILPIALKTQAKSYTISNRFQKADSERGVLACLRNFKDERYVVQAHNHVLLEQFGKDESEILRAASRCADRMLMSRGVSAEEGSEIFGADEREFCQQASRSFIEEDPQFRALRISWAVYYGRISEAENWICKQFYFLVKDSFLLG